MNLKFGIGVHYFWEHFEYENEYEIEYEKNS